MPGDPGSRMRLAIVREPARTHSYVATERAKILSRQPALWLSGRTRTTADRRSRHIFNHRDPQLWVKAFRVQGPRASPELPREHPPQVSSQEVKRLEPTELLAACRTHDLPNL